MDNKVTEYRHKALEADQSAADCRSTAALFRQLADEQAEQLALKHNSSPSYSFGHALRAMYLQTAARAEQAADEHRALADDYRAGALEVLAATA